MNARVVALDDLVAMKATALASRGAPRDFIDVSAAARIYPFREIERLIRLRNGEETIQAPGRRRRRGAGL